jgi:hypothetical protein
VSIAASRTGLRAASQIASRSTRDYDLYGVVGIRVLDGREPDIGSLERQIGLDVKGLDRAPDLTIRYVDRLPLTSKITYLAGDAAFAGNSFVLTAGRDRRPAVQLPFAQLGSNCELMVVRGLPEIPLLIPILNLTAIRNGYLPVRASAFDYYGMGVLMAGESHGGRTGTLLAFMAQGASFVGDDWVLVHRDGRAMYGLPTPTHVEAAYLEALPQFRARLDKKTQRRIRAVKTMLALESRLLPAQRSPSALARGRARYRASLAGMLSVRVSPRRLFSSAACVGVGAPDLVFLARSVDSPGVSVKPVETKELVRRLVPLLDYEWTELDRTYALFRSAFPRRRNPLIEGKEKYLEAGLETALKEKQTYEIRYPTPAPVDEVFAVLEPLILSHRSHSVPRVADLETKHRGERRRR